MARWLAKEFDWDTGRYTGRYYDIAEAGIVAVFVDSFYGDDTAAGTAVAPFKTLGAAITYLNANGADGSRIFMNGIFSETLPAQTYWYEFIGCGGGRNGRTVWENNSVALTKPYINKLGTKVHNVETLNYDYNSFFIRPNSGTSFYYFINCYIKYINIDYSGGASYSRIYFYKCILLDIKAESGSFTESQDRNLPIYGNQNIFYNCNPTKVVFLEYCSNSHSWLTDMFFQFTNTKGNIRDVNGQYVNPSQNDFNVRITSPLLQAGTVDEMTGIAANVGGVEVGLPYNGITPEFTTQGGATITDLTIDTNGKITITAPATTGTLETALMDLGNIYPLENIDLFNVFDFLSGEITQGVFETFSSPRMALTIKMKYGLTSAEVDDCPWLLIEYGKQPTYSGSGASRVGNADDTFDPDTFQEITCRYMKLFITLQNNS